METVPVRGMPKDRTCIGTVRALPRLFRVDALIMEYVSYSCSGVNATWLL